MNIAFVLISLCVLFVQYDTTFSLNGTTATIEFNQSSTVNTNSLSLIRNVTKRRKFLILNSDNPLRQGRPGQSGKGKSRKRAVTSLLYEERDDKGNKLNSVMMYNLEDVSKFFEVFLDTVICNVVCEDDD